MLETLMTDSPVLTITEDALSMIISLRDQEPGDDEYGLSIEVTGMRGMEFNYELAFVPVADLKEGWVLERHGDLAVMFPESDIPKLQGASLTLTDQGLAMNNPNTPSSPEMGPPPGDLEGPLAERVQTVIDTRVNPAIAAHGGGAELVSVDGTVVYLRLQGGCVGCGLATVTLKQGIERILVEAIPEITEVVDVTDHTAGTDPYYQSSKK